MPSTISAWVTYLEDLHREGWRLQDNLRVIEFEGTAGSSGVELSSRIANLVPVIDSARLELRNGPNRFELSFHDANWLVTEIDAADLETSFEGNELDAARSAAQSVAAAALSLTGEWSIRGTFDLAKPFRTSGDYHLFALRTLGSLEEAIDRTPWWELHNLVKQNGMKVGFLVAEDGVILSTATIAVSSKNATLIGTHLERGVIL